MGNSETYIACIKLWSKSILFLYYLYVNEMQPLAMVYFYSPSFPITPNPFDNVFILRNKQIVVWKKCVGANSITS